MNTAATTKSFTTRVLKIVVVSVITVVLLSSQQLTSDVASVVIQDGIEPNEAPTEIVTIAEELLDDGIEYFGNETLVDDVEGKRLLLLLANKWKKTTTASTSSTTTTTTTTTTSTTTTTTTTTTVASGSGARHIYFWEEDYDFTFTANWFRPDLPQWSDLIDEFEGKPVKLLEIGSYEGRSAIWMLDNICTHPDCTLTTIDTFEGSPHWRMPPAEIEQIEARFRSNIMLSGKQKQVEIIKGKSVDTLIDWKKTKTDSSQLSRAFDFVYIDGAHEADTALWDALLVWPLLKNNGIIIFDDYQLQRHKEPYNNPQLGIDAFVAIHRWEIEVLQTNYQLTIRKVERQRPFTLFEETGHTSDEEDKLETING